MKRHEMPKIADTQPDRAMRELIQRRTEPFLIFGTHLPIAHVLGEAYLQGMRDAVQAISDARPT